MMNNKLVIGLTILSILLAIATFSSCSIAYRTKVARDKEMMARIELEERMSQSLPARSMPPEVEQKPAPTPAPASAPAQTPPSAPVDQHATQQALVAEQIANQELREEVGRLTSEVRALEEKLQEVLTSTAE